MSKVLIFGNSGSGKSTLAKALSSKYELAHLDLDTLAWHPSSPPTRRSLLDCQRDISLFTQSHDDWVVEGCYSDLLEMVISESDEIIFLNLPVEACIRNARNRLWEPHKYATKEAQDENLAMLIDWIAQYPEREDTFSMAAHSQLYATYPGKKRMITSNIKQDSYLNA